MWVLVNPPGLDLPAVGDLGDLGEPPGLDLPAAGDLGVLVNPPGLDLPAAVAVVSPSKLI